jgi:inorganic phosphate transporter, PiT family
VSAVRWGVAGNIVTAWILTFPMAALIGAATYGFIRIFGTGATGPVVVSILGLALLTIFLARRARNPVPAV